MRAEGRRRQNTDVDVNADIDAVVNVAAVDRRWSIVCCHALVTWKAEPLAAVSHDEPVVAGIRAATV